VSDSKSNAYGYAVRLIPILCVAGCVTALLGVILKKNWALKIGAVLFLSGIAFWGLANGGALLWGFVHTVRKEGSRPFIKYPWLSALYVFLMLFLLASGGFFVWLIIRTSAHSK